MATALEFTTAPMYGSHRSTGDVHVRVVISRYSQRHVLAACASITTPPIHCPHDALPVRITAAMAHANLCWRRWSFVGFARRTNRTAVWQLL